MYIHRERKRNTKAYDDVTQMSYFVIFRKTKIRQSETEMDLERYKKLAKRDERKHLFDREEKKSRDEKQTRLKKQRGAK